MFGNIKRFFGYDTDGDFPGNPSKDSKYKEFESGKYTMSEIEKITRKQICRKNKIILQIPYEKLPIIREKYMKVNQLSDSFGNRDIMYSKNEKFACELSYYRLNYIDSMTIKDQENIFVPNNICGYFEIEFMFNYCNKDKDMTIEECEKINKLADEYFDIWEKFSQPFIDRIKKECGIE